MKRENKFRKVYVKGIYNAKINSANFTLRACNAENKFREFRYFSSLQPRNFLPAKISSREKFLPLRYKNHCDEEQSP